MGKPLILVDGSSYLYRAFHAMPPLTNAAGQPTGAVYGVINMLRKLINDEQPELIAVVFDAKGKTFRHEMYADYKAHRPPMPDDLVAQIKPVHEVVIAMGLPLLMIEGVEADDVIGTLAKQASDAKRAVLISTSDKDMAQLVNEHVTLVNTMTNTTMNVKGVHEKFGVWPNQIIDYLTLMGDTSDNVPGVDKVGPKTAAKWLEEYQTLDNIIEHADKVKGKIGDNLRAALPLLPISKALVTIKCDVELPLSFDKLKMRGADLPVLKTMYEHLTFKNWAKELGPVASAPTSSAPVPTETRNTGYICIQDQEVLRAWVKDIEAQGWVSVDTETTSLHAREARVVGVSLATADGKACYIPLTHSEAVILRPMLENPAIRKIGQNIKYDKMVLRNEGIELQGIAFDTMLESYMNNSTLHRHDLDTLAKIYCDHAMITYEEVTGKGKNQIGFAEVPLDKATEYAAEDADYTLRVHEQLWPLLQEKPRCAALYQNLEIPLISVLADMEYRGVLIDGVVLAQQSEYLAERLSVVEAHIYKSSGETFNVDSPKQLQWILYDKLGLPITQKTPTGQPSTAEPVLQELAVMYELPALILEYRSLSKLKSTYTDKLPLMISPTTGRVHTSYQQAVTATGRLSSTDPNLQNIPIRTEVGRKIRQAFIAPKGSSIVAVDYSQIELRIMAHLSEDAGLMTAFQQGLDVHAATASEVFGIPLSEVSSEDRRRAKAINFGLIYGMSAFGLAKQIGSKRDEAQLYIETYFHRYPGVKAYMERTRAQAASMGYVETLRGRRLYLPDIKSSNFVARSAAERTAINAPMQGTAADIIKQAMLNVSAWIASSGLNVNMVMQVHDELVFEVADDILPQAKAKIIDIMQHATELNVPLLVQAGVGRNWDEAH